MRNWGIVVTAFYAIVVLLLLSFGMISLAEDWWAFETFDQSDIGELVLLSLIPTAFLVGGQVLLLFLSVDSSWRRMKPQRHAKITAGLVGIMVTILGVAIMFSIATGLRGDNFQIPILQQIDEGWLQLVVFLATIAVIWGIWGIVFYSYSKRSSDVADSAVSWLIKGSVLELLVAVPCHIIVRQREWCCAQYISAYGIAAGIAIMLMAFGPSAMFLYKRKLEEYKYRTAA
jgi:hypothetical protein